MRKVHPQEATNLLVSSCASFPKFGREVMTQQGYWDKLTDGRRKVAEEILEAHKSLLTAQELEVDWSLIDAPQNNLFYMRLLPNDTIAVYFPKDMYGLRERIKSIQGARYAHTHWCFTLTLEVCEALPQLAADYSFKVPQEVYQAIEQSKINGLAAVKDSRSAEATLPTWLLDRLNGTPYPFQSAGILFGLNHKRIFINDEMGLGKTIQALGILEGSESFKTLVIVPNTVKLGWVAEILTWLPKRSVSVYMSNTTKPVTVQARGEKIKVPVNNPYSDIVVINYDQLKKQLRYLKPHIWKCIIVDESHYMANPKAARTRSVLELVESVKPEYRLALTGTPVANKPHELITQLQFLGRLEEQFGTKTRFMQQFCNFRPSGYGGVIFGDPDLRVLHSLNQKLRPFQVRRLKRDVLTELPDKRRITLEIEITNRNEYDLAMKNLLVWLKDYTAQNKRFLASISQYPVEQQQTLIKQRIATAQERALRGMAFRKIQALRYVAIKGKIPSVIDWVKGFLTDTDEKLVVYCIHREIQEELFEKFPGAARLYGGDSLVVRKQNEQRFQQDPKCRLIVCSIPAASEGITLTAASNMAIIELPWTALKCDQTEDRIHRIGQPNAAMIFYLVAQNTIDEEIASLIDGKRNMMAAITDGEDAEEEMGILDSLISRLTD